MYIEQIPQTSIEAYKLKRVAAYARVSSDKDAAEHSLEAQIDYYKKYITDYPGWLFSGIYADNGISGTKDDRPEFQRMLSDCRAGKVDMIITKSITRFARNIVTLLSTARELKLLGIDVFFEKENTYANSANGEFLLSLLAIHAEEEARSASENTLWSIKKKFEKGQPTYFRIYGYRWIEGQLQVEEAEAAVVRQIFNDYLSGMGYEAIAKRLNRKSVYKDNPVWYPFNIYSMLRNEKYIGNLLLQKTYTTDFRSKKKAKNRGTRTQYFVQNSHEPIIDKEVFDRVQLEISRRQETVPVPARSFAPLLFTGLIQCGACGSTFCHKKMPTSRHEQISVWICNTYKTLGKDKCAAKRIRESVLIDKTKQVLGLNENTELTREIILDHIDSIESAADNKLRFFLKSGKVEVVKWENPSRAKSWTPEMKERARQKSLEAAKRRREGNHE